MAAILEALHLDPWTFLFQIINLLIVMGVLYILLWKPVGKLLEEREHRIESQLKDAAQAKEQSEQLLREYEAKMAGVKHEAHEVIAKATKLGEEMREDLVAKAREEAERALSKAKAEIQAEKAKALAAIREEASTLAVLAAAKVLERDINTDDHRRLVREFIQEVGEKQ
ncbi:MAG: F0F1 ATP synthase subunit B [Bacillota bacterium]